MDEQLFSKMSHLCRSDPETEDRMKPFILSKNTQLNRFLRGFFAFPHSVVLLGPLMVNSLSRA